MILPDLHVHPTPWQMGTAGFREMAQSAGSHGVDILGFAEHGPPLHSAPRYRGLSELDVELYVRAVLQMKDEFRSVLQIFCGLELDYHPEKLAIYEQWRRNYPFDYFLGSVHLMDDWHLDDPASLPASVHRHKSLPELYRLYYQQITEAAEGGMFSALSHLDYIRRSLPHPPGQPPDFARDIFAETAEKIEACGVAVELNTRGLTLTASPEIYPTKPFLNILVRSGVKFTLGSDAHEANRVGEGIEQAKRILRDEAVNEVCYFQKFLCREIEL